MKKAILVCTSFLIYSCAANISSSDQDATRGQYHYELGMSSFLLKNYSEAIANFNKASQLMPRDPKVWNALGIAYTEVQEYEKAEAAFLKAIEIDKKFSETYLNRGIMYYKRGDYTKAKENLDVSISDETFDKKHISYYYLAKVYQQMGNTEMYVNNLIKASLYNQNFLEPQIELARFYEENKDYTKASEVYLRLVQRNPQIDPRIRLDAARNLWLSGNTELSKIIISELMKDRNIDTSVSIQARTLLDQILISEHKQKHGIMVMHKESSERTEVWEQKDDQLFNTVRIDTKEDYSSSESSKILQSKEDHRSDSNTPKVENTRQSLSKERVFYIQLAAFSMRANADAFKSRLEETAALSNITIAERDNLYKVMLGPYTSRADAERELNKIRKLKLNGIVVTE